MSFFIEVSRTVFSRIYDTHVLRSSSSSVENSSDRFRGNPFRKRNKWVPILEYDSSLDKRNISISEPKATRWQYRKKCFFLIRRVKKGTYSKTLRESWSCTIEDLLCFSREVSSRKDCIASIVVWKKAKFFTISCNIRRIVWYP